MANGTFEATFEIIPTRICFSLPWQG